MRPDLSWIVNVYCSVAVRPVCDLPEFRQRLEGGVCLRLIGNSLWTLSRFAAVDLHAQPAIVSNQITGRRKISDEFRPALCEYM